MKRKTREPPGNSRSGWRKGFLFTLDALLASLLILAATGFLLHYAPRTPSSPVTTYYAQDALRALSTIRVGELNNTWVRAQIDAGAITDPELSVIEQAGAFWAANETGLARNLTAILLDGLLPPGIGASFSLEGEILFERNGSGGEPRFRSSARRMITGVAKGEARSGSSGEAHLKRIRGRELSRYLFFGGFVGQGNITVLLDLPSDLNESQVSGFWLEADIDADFNLFVNGAQCNGLFTPNWTGNYTPDSWNLSACTSLLRNGTNSFLFSFPGGVNTAYISGGFLRVSYSSEVFQEATTPGFTRQSLPELKGVVNLYDSFDVPGNLTGLSIVLHYLANHSEAENSTFYLTIGNVTIFLDENSTTEQRVTITNATLADLLNYTLLSTRTVPFRVGFQNITFTTTYVGDADVVLITDVSGSMDREMGSDNTGTPRNCDDQNINSSDTSRLSVAKCLDKQFASNILNVSGNKVGLVSYATATNDGETVTPTTNFSVLNATIGTAVPETGYGAGGWTCICCGINSAYDELTSGVTVTSLVSPGESWLYETNNFSGAPPPTNGSEWYEERYNDSSWKSGNAVLGSLENGVGPPIVTDMGNSISTASLYPNLWDMSADAATVQVDFTSGLNQTGNTFGPSGGVNDDGWDSQHGAFGTGGSDVYLNTDPNEDGSQADNTVLSDKDLRIFIGNDWDDDAPSADEIPDSGAFGIELYITPAMYEMVATGSAALYFDWLIDPTYLDPGEEGWIKAQFGVAGNTTWLGTQLDQNGTISDASPEVFWCEDTGWSAPDPDHACPNPGTGTFSWNLTPLINQSGWYYLVIGAKATEQPGDTTWDENWRFYFDNIYIEIKNQSDRYYLRKSFTVADSSLVRKAFLNILSDDLVDVYLNGQLVYNQTTVSTPSYWNVRGAEVPDGIIHEGSNLLAVKLSNSGGAAKFDLELRALNQSRNLAMMVMTDGQANEECSRQGVTGDLDGDGSADTASDDAIQAACDAREDYGATVYAVGFSDNANEETLRAIASCGGGLYKRSSNTSELEEFYSDVAAHILTASLKSQSVVVEGSFAPSILYNDSYFNITYEPSVLSPAPTELELLFQTPPLGNCTPQVAVPPGIRIAEAVITSYSGIHWTDYVSVNGGEAFNLSRFSEEYAILGDPYRVSVPASLLVPGALNNLTVRIGDSPQNSSGCSKNNTLIYRGFVNSTTPRSPVVSSEEGCSWLIEFEEGSFQTVKVPLGYAGSKECNYTNASIAYDAEDAYNLAIYNLLSTLDFDGDGRVLVNFGEEDLEIVVTLVTSVPYLWGPAIASLEVWQ